jgi:hypothetical protein
MQNLFIYLSSLFINKQLLKWLLLKLIYISFIFQQKGTKKGHCRNKHLEKKIFHGPGSTEHFFSTAHENPPEIHRSQNNGFRC